MREVGERLAIYDRETGLYAYWYFNLRLEEEMVRSRRYGQRFVLLLLEAMSARLGLGEERVLFDAMNESFRESDLVAHLGNLRFLALLTNTDQASAPSVLRRLRERLGQDTIQMRVASYPDGGEDWASLLRAAGVTSKLMSDAQRKIENLKAGKPREAALDLDGSQTVA